MFALLTITTYLILGSVAVRFFFSTESEVSFKTSATNTFDFSNFPDSSIELESPEIKFTKIHADVPEEVAKRKPAVETMVPEIAEEEFGFDENYISGIQLPFHEPIKLEPVVMDYEIPVRFFANYKDFYFKEEIVVESKNSIVEDAVSSGMAHAEEIEPEFFEYPVKKENNNLSENDKVLAETNEILPDEVITENFSSSVNPALDSRLSDSGYSPTINQKSSAEEKSSKTTENFTSTSYYPNPSPQKNYPIMGFDYSRAERQSPKLASQSGSKARGPLKGLPGSDKKISSSGKSISGYAPKKKKTKRTLFPIAMTIQSYAFDLKRIEEISGFEVRFKDDQSSSITDYGTGEVKIADVLSHDKMTRSVTLLKRGYIPTSSDLILEEGEVTTTIPMIEETKFNELMEKYEGRTSVGAFLVELDDDTDVAQLDVPFGEVLTLNSELVPTKEDNFRFLLFLGVRAGNGLVTFIKRNGEKSQKIVHIHENELTFDANYYENAISDKVRLYEDDLLSKVPSPLIISADEVRLFASDVRSEKINNHTYKLKFGPTGLGGRRYLELVHQKEPVYVGIKDNINVMVPSENFMQHVLSRLEGRSLGDRCLVQVNLRERANNVEIGTESLSSSLMTYTQMLDNDGKFYDSLSEKTQKIIIVGESNIGGDQSSDGRINIKINYANGSTQYLNSYCSPNTYLVEQL